MSQLNRPLPTPLLKAYKQYLDLYPSGSKADLALMRVATIYSEQKNHDAKLLAYRRLIAEYPDSRFVVDAMVEILDAFYNKSKFKEVILQASEIIKKTDSKTHLFRTYTILGDTYMSLICRLVLQEMPFFFIALPIRMPAFQRKRISFSSSKLLSVS
jgi:outer membrane protein assembly factor BamD (BamD/ComL family)